MNQIIAGFVILLLSQSAYSADPEQRPIIHNEDYYLVQMGPFITDPEKRLIIHVEDYHMVEKVPFIEDQFDQNPDLSNEEIIKAYTTHLIEVNNFQVRQREVLLKLLDKYDLDCLYQERLVIGETKDFDVAVWGIKFVMKMKNTKEAYLLKGFQGYSHVLMIAGNSGQLLAEENIKKVHPVEDAQLFIEANPMKSGQFKIDEKANEAREDFIIQQMLKSNDQVMILICGRAHDFSNNIPQGIRLKRIEIPIKEN